MSENPIDSSDPDPQRRPKRKYTLERQIGRGGMGEVWRSRDESLGRDVALKLLSHDDPDDLARFRREAELAARLSHPNIAALYEFGEQDSRPFIAMQLIDGLPLDRAGLSARDAAEAMRAAAEAVQHAHDLGVIHRDLKPANIMIDRARRVYVMDFGLARSTKGVSSLSMSGQIVGTPAFMAPEQARGDRADERSDVYGLGATLYALATGRAPFGGDNLMKIIGDVVGSDPPTPRRLAPAVPWDLETIVMKAMEKAPVRRYASARAMAEDLRRFLAGDAIEARPTSTAYRVWKQLRKHPVPYGLATLLAAAVVGGVALGLDRLATERRAQASLEELRRLDEKMRQVRERVAEAEELETEQAFHRERWNLLLAEAERECEAAAARRGDYATAWYEWGRIKMARRQWDAAIEKFGEAVRRDSEYGQAYYARAQALAEKIFELEEESTTAHQTAPNLALERRWLDQALDDLGRIDLGSLEKSQGIELDLLAFYLKGDWAGFEIALRRVEAVDRARWRLQRLEAEAAHRMHRYEDAARSYESITASRRSAAWAWIRYSHLLVDAADYDKAIVAATGALSIDDTSADAHFHRGYSYFEKGQVDRALRDYDRALSIREDDANVYNARANAHSRLGRIDLAMEDFAKALTLRPDFAIALVNRGALYADLGDLDKAFEDYDRAAEIDDRLPVVHLNRGNAYVGKGEFERAIEEYDRVLEIQPSNGKAHFNRGNANALLKRHDLAIEDFTRSLKFDRDDPDAYFRRGSAYGAVGENARAIEDYTKALELKDDFAEAYVNRGSAYKIAGRYDLAVKDYERGLELAPAGWSYRPAVERSLEDARRLLSEGDF